jgi:hypothetical protein
MTQQTTITPRRSLWRKAVKVLAIAGAVLIVLLIVAHFAWKYSGSNQWELALDRSGVRVYALKAPGTPLKQFRAVTRMKTTLNRIVAAMTDTSTEACAEFVPGCVSGAILEPWSVQSRQYVQAYRVAFPRPFTPRDLIVKTTFSQDPKSKSMLVECTALPDALPRDACCIRVTEMHNSWRYTPVGNGEIEVEFLANYDAGIPYVIFNRAGPIGMPQILKRLEGFFNKPKYQQTTFPFVSES